MGGETITIAFKGENDANAMDIEFENEEERDKEWDKIKFQISYALIFQAPSQHKSPFYTEWDNKGATPV